MTQSHDKALLPAGLTDGLPPLAGHEANVRERLVQSFTVRGFDRVAPPLVEFEDHLLTGTGAAMSEQTFRLMDPVSQRMMGVRADVTPQVARIASTRLAHLPRPMRLCYAGEVLRIRGTQLRPERQFTQAGAELIGDDSPAADAEMILTAAEALQELGIEDIKVDLCQPTLVPAVMADHSISEDTARRIRDALDRKDIAEVRGAASTLGDDVQALLVSLLSATGPADTVRPALADLDLSSGADAARRGLLETLDVVRSAAPNLAVTLDAVENRGFEYHTGVTFTLFAPGVRGELGSGGRYAAGVNGGGGEAATGFTLFLDSILRALPAPSATDTVYLPAGTGREIAAELRAGGFRTVQGLHTTDTEQEAKRLGCTHVLIDGAPKLLDT